MYQQEYYLKGTKTGSFDLSILCSRPLLIVFSSSVPVAKSYAPSCRFPRAPPLAPLFPPPVRLLVLLLLILASSPLVSHFVSSLFRRVVSLLGLSLVPALVSYLVPHDCRLYICLFPSHLRGTEPSFAFFSSFFFRIEHNSLH